MTAYMNSHATWTAYWSWSGSNTFMGFLYADSAWGESSGLPEQPQAELGSIHGPAQTVGPFYAE